MLRQCPYMADVEFDFPPEILRAPESTVVFLGKSAVFSCETVGDVTTWRVNGTLLENLPPEIHNELVVSGTNTLDGTRVEELTIPARAEYNGTGVQCLVGIFGGSTDESENATLKIQGIACMCCIMYIHWQLRCTFNHSLAMGFYISHLILVVISGK